MLCHQQLIDLFMLIFNIEYGLLFSAGSHSEKNQYNQVS